MRTIDTFGCTAEIKTAVALLSVDLDDKLCAYRLGQGPLPGQTLPPQLESYLGLRVIEGLATRKSVVAFKKGRKPNIVEVQNLSLVDPSLLEDAANHGFMEAFRLQEKKGVNIRGEVNNVFTAFTENNAQLDHLVRVDWSSNLIFNRVGQLLPVAIQFDYIMARMHDGCYDLEKAAAVLSKDPRVKFLPGERSYSRDDVDSPIKRIPSYNATSGQTQYIPFLFSPTAEDSIRMWDQMVSYRTQYPSTTNFQAIWDLDLLGLRKAGAARYDGFHDSKPCETHRDCDD